MSVIRWEEPPHQSRGPKPEVSSAMDPRWASTVAAQLRAQPCAWALVWEAGDASEASNISLRICGARSAFRAFDAVSRKGDDNIYRVYARYVGEASDAVA